MKPFKRWRPSVELLEDRCVPTNSVTLSGGVLSIVADPKSAHVAMVLQQTPGVTQVVLDGKVTTFTDTVNEVDYTGGNKNNLFTNATSVSGTLTFGNGDNVIYSQAPGERIIVGNGNNFIQDLGPGSSISAGNGNNNIYGGASDTISVGKGRDVIYDIAGANTINLAPHHSRDFIFTNAGSTVNGATADDRVAVFFAANRQAGSGSLVLDHGVLYFTANNNGDKFTLNRVGNKYIAVYNLNDGTGVHTQTFKQSQINLLATYGGAGNDTFINNTTVPDVQNGAGGNNVIVGGFGALDVEKAGDTAGNSVVIGRSFDRNDVSGSGATGTKSVLVVNPFAHNVVRTSNAGDKVLGFWNDVLINPFNLKSGKVHTPALPPAPPPPPPPSDPPPPTPPPPGHPS